LPAPPSCAPRHACRFGSPDELKALIDEAHRLGMVVLMDIVHRCVAQHACVRMCAPHTVNRHCICAVELSALMELSAHGALVHPYCALMRLSL